MPLLMPFYTDGAELYAKAMFQNKKGLSHASIDRQDYLAGFRVSTELRNILKSLCEVAPYVFVGYTKFLVSDDPVKLTCLKTLVEMGQREKDEGRLYDNIRSLFSLSPGMNP